MSLQTSSSGPVVGTDYIPVRPGSKVQHHSAVTEMTMHALLLAAVLVLSPLDGLAGEKQIGDVEELAGRWRGWVNEVAGDEWATMSVSPDGSFKASTFSGTIVGKVYLQDGKLRDRSSRATPRPM